MPNYVGKTIFEDNTNAAKLCKEFSIQSAVGVINTKHVANQVPAIVQLSIDFGARAWFTDRR